VIEVMTPAAGLKTKNTRDAARESADEVSLVKAQAAASEETPTPPKHKRPWKRALRPRGAESPADGNTDQPFKYLSKDQEFHLSTSRDDALRESWVKLCKSDLMLFAGIRILEATHTKKLRRDYAFGIGNKAKNVLDARERYLAQNIDELRDLKINIRKNIKVLIDKRSAPADKIAARKALTADRERGGNLVAGARLSSRYLLPLGKLLREYAQDTKDLWQKLKSKESRSEDYLAQKKALFKRLMNLGEKPERAEGRLEAFDSQRELYLAARDKLIHKNIRLVMRIANQYTGQGRDFEDLRADGYVGLIRSAETFDGSTGFRFTTYATTCIRRAIEGGFRNDGRIVRIKAGGEEHRRKYFISEQKEEQLLGRSLSWQESFDLFCKLYGFNGRKSETKERKAFEMYGAIRAASMTPKSLSKMSAKMHLEDSLAVKLADVDPEPLQELIYLEDLKKRENLLSRISRAIEDSTELTKRQKDVVWRRLVKEEGLKEIAESYGLSKESIRKDEIQAVNILRQDLKWLFDQIIGVS
jgi:RNA polymerase sigma factor (sigma-70 family)